MLSEGGLEQALGAIIAKTPHLISIVCCEARDRAQAPTQKDCERVGIYEEDVCCDSSCTIPLGRHFGAQYIPLVRCSRDFLRQIFTCLNTYDRKLSEFLVDRIETSLDVMDFNTGGPALHLSTQIGNLSKLRLSLELDSRTIRCMQHQVAPMLRQASCLQYLFLTLTYKRTSDPFYQADPNLSLSDLRLDTSLYLEACQLPKLKSLLLCGLLTDEDSLVQFLTDHPLLQHLTLSNIKLLKGSWKRGK